jgi:hypothetical protein
MAEKKPPSFVRTGVQNRCPVCGEISYSQAGVHPQCSMRQADQKRSLSLKRAKELAKSGKAAAPPKAESRWQKACPKCKVVQHVRKSVCVCGHVFAVSPGA